MIYFNLNKYLPPVVSNIKDLQQINEVGSMELRRFYLSSIQILKNFSIITCDIGTIEQNEQLLNIDNEDDTTEIRRQKLLLQLNLMIPYTIETLKSKLNSILGIDGYVININYNQQTYLILVYQKEGVTQKTIKLIENLMLIMPPSHLQGDVKLGSSIDTNSTEYFGVASSQATIYDIDFVY